MKILHIIIILLAFSSLLNAHNSYLGVFLDELSTNEKENLHLEGGVRIVEVVKGSPAEEAGLQKQMIILKINNQATNSSDELQKIIQSMNIGSNIELTIRFNNKEEIRRLILGDIRDYYKKSTTLSLGRSNKKYIGLKLQKLNAQLADFFNVDSGLLVTEVDSKSPAEKAKITAGDVIITIEETAIKNEKQFRNLLQTFDINSVINITFIRNGEKIVRAVKIGKNKDFKGIYLEYDPERNVIIYGPDIYETEIIDLNSIKDWITDIFPDSSKKMLQNEIDQMQNEIEKLKSKINEM